MTIALPSGEKRRMTRSCFPIAPQESHAPPTRQLLLDVSNIANSDARTGIQRVVRAVASAMQRLPLNGYRVRLIAANRDTFYRYLPDDWLEQSDVERLLDLDHYPPVDVTGGDIFLGLDFCSSILCRHEKRLVEWRDRGVELNIFLYDLLPLTHGHWFSFRMRRKFRRWVTLVERVADRVIAISQSVAMEFDAWQDRRRGRLPRVRVTTGRLGCDISASLPSRGLPADGSKVLSWMERHPTVLMVGTVEPRKGYEHALAAFDCLWEDSQESPQLLVIGRAGWKTDRLQRRMRLKSRTDGRFLWLDTASDEFLEEIYKRAAGLLVASEGEGFGLPIVEALSFGRRVLARDLPVFRELDGPGVSYFTSRSAAELAAAVSSWLTDGPAGTANRVRGTVTWDEAAAELAAVLIPTYERLAGAVGEDMRRRLWS
jgi:glycosyltransferase involved in cell wall biosynthesis